MPSAFENATAPPGLKLPQGSLCSMPTFLSDEPAFLPTPSAVNFSWSSSVPRQQKRHTGSWDAASLASTAAGDDSLSSGKNSPRRQCSTSSDEEGTAQFRAIPEDVGKEADQAKEQPPQSFTACTANLSSAESPPQCVGAKPDEIQAERTCEDGQLWIRWPADARKLKTKDRQIVSPSFQISPSASIKLIAKPKSAGKRKGEGCFRSSEGMGAIELKFMEGTEVAPKIRFCVSMGEQSPRGPFEHDFGKSRVCAMTQMEDWDFRACVDADSSTFHVSLQLLSIIPPGVHEK